MRRWEVSPSSASASCVSKPALWWAWARVGQAPAQAAPAWNAAWTGHALIDTGAAGADDAQRVAIIERAANGVWIATEWRWNPSPRAATREWQAGRWKLLTDAARARRQPASSATDAGESLPLLLTWEKNLNGRPAEITANGWYWESGGMCLQMEAVARSQAQLHLPYAREDGRLEQRSAMQLRLARTYPKATWMTPFRLLPPSTAAAHGGAKYEAIWREEHVVKGQLWMPTKVAGAILRARIAVVLPVVQGVEEDAMASRAATLIDQELSSLATRWAVDNER